jgi:hypothetical protein
MPATSAKNKPLTGVATDIGLGDSLNQQVQDETEEMRKRRLLLQQQRQALGGGAASALLGGGGVGY